MSFVRRSGQATYGGSHVGSRGSLESIKHSGGDDFSEGISLEDQLWEELVRAAFITREASFHQRWAEDGVESDDWELERIKAVYGSDYESKGTFKDDEGLFRPFDH
jgi:hypothetical protein